MRTSLKFMMASALLMGTAIAEASPISVYGHSIYNPSDGSFEGVNTVGGTVSGIHTTYDEGAQTFSWTYDVAPASNGATNDGFWLVVSDGPDPKDDENEYAILFGDLDTGRLTAYLYNGENRSNSWKKPNGVLLQSFDAGTIEVVADSSGSDKKTVSFAVSVSGINAYAGGPEWDGVSFAEQIGIWFHPTTGTSIKYDATTQEITRFAPTTAGWYDGKDITVSQVPEPSTLYLAGLGLIAFALSRKRFNSRRRHEVSTRGELATRLTPAV